MASREAWSFLSLSQHLYSYVVATGRKMIDATQPLDSAPATIRGDFALEAKRNLIHGSDAVESGTREIALWFPQGTVNWQSSLHCWIYE